MTIFCYPLTAEPSFSLISQTGLVRVQEKSPGLKSGSI